MSRPDDLDRAEARAAAARARLNESTAALQTQLKPRALAQALRDSARERQRALIGGTVAVVAAAGAIAVVAGLLRRRRAERLADPPAYAKRIAPTSPKPPAPPRVRVKFKRTKP